jgi:hypothetical protein
VLTRNVTIREKGAQSFYGARSEKRSSMKLKPSWQVGRKARSWINMNGECVFWVRGFKSRECAEEYQADLFETTSDQKEVTGFMIMPAVGRGSTWQLIAWSTDTPLPL